VTGARTLVRKLVAALATVGFVLVLNFFLFRVLPGDPARAGVADPRLSEESIALLRARFGLDRPVVNGIESLHPLRFGSFWVDPLETQFASYFFNLAARRARNQLPLQPSGRRDSSPSGSATPCCCSPPGSCWRSLVGVALGAFAAARSGQRADRLALFGGLAAWSLPSFWLAMVLLFLGATLFGLPLGGRATPALEAGWFGHALDLARHLVLPTLTFTIVYFGEYLLVTRSALLDVLSEDYVLVARAKGLTRAAGPAAPRPARRRAADRHPGGSISASWSPARCRSRWSSPGRGSGGDVRGRGAPRLSGAAGRLPAPGGERRDRQSRRSSCSIRVSIRGRARDERCGARSGTGMVRFGAVILVAVRDLAALAAPWLGPAARRSPDDDRRRLRAALRRALASAPTTPAATCCASSCSARASRCWSASSPRSSRSASAAPSDWSPASPADASRAG
jgi:ABC-type dipeptide/oligopeptide/nickel transport system permease component